MKGPEAFLEPLGLALESALGSGVPARIAPHTRAVVNGHFFWVADASELASLRAEPHRYTGPLLDPARHEWFEPDEASPRLDVGGEILLFASAETRKLMAEADAAPGHVH